MNSPGPMSRLGTWARAAGSSAGFSCWLLAQWSSAILHAADWPQWRGPDRDGVWHERGMMNSFPTGGLHFSWRAPVGRGYSSPVVMQGRVYLSDAQVVRPTAK